MSESITISKKTPQSKSMNYNFLREEGIKYIQGLAGKIWTDYNIHDPGVTTLEVLCYAITELGYRAGYPVQDLLATDPNAPENQDIKNFHTARGILPNAPVTINDYRKLLIDVDVAEPSNSGCRNVGVKNAWIEKSRTNEIPVYVHKQDSKLDYEQDPGYVPSPGETTQPPLEIGILYDILLEFEKCDAYGDLNENSITRTLVIDEHLPDTNLNGLTIKITVEFPRWDNEDTDWYDILSIKANVQNIKLTFSNVPNGYEFGYELVNNIIKLTGSITTASDIINIPGLDEIETKVNDFIYYNDDDSLRTFYLQKVSKIQEIIKEVKARLHANRNLCEDFYKLSALKVEKIAVCADIELDPEADINDVQARIYHEIGRFLSPTVHFYTLDEMLDKCKVPNDYPVLEIDEKNKSFTVKGDLEEKLATGDTITISGSRSNDGHFTVISVTVDADAGQTKIFVAEDITSGLLTEGEKLSFYTTDEDTCLTADRIFEGPPLDHGFIDDDELEKAGRRKFIHVSDLIQIIMDIQGVTAVKSIQIANIPQDNEDGSIPSKSVKWCMALAFDQNYVPRLSPSDSKITFYKDQLPFRASSSKVDTKIELFEQQERPAKLFNPVLDFEVPGGDYRNLESYESIQNEFPLTYGIGEEGFPTRGNDKDANTLREARARQFKGYLMMFDQLLANYFSQLAHVKDLFSMNAEKDESGNYIIGRTYYTQPLFDIVPGADVLYLDKNGHRVTLDNIAEDETLFNTRKNKFLDHLIGRFAEKFTDYALLTMKLSGEQKGPVELIEDKLAFLNAYPQISSGRGKGFNYTEPCMLWQKDNVSGLRHRTSFLAGIEETDTGDLHFSGNFRIVPEGDGYRIKVYDSTNALLLKSYEIYDDGEQVLAELEKMILNGVVKDNYQILSEDDINFYFALDCGLMEVLGISKKENYPDNLPGGEADLDIDKLTELFKNEFYRNAESNRNNLACPLLNYIDYSILVNMGSDPPVAIVSFNLYSSPLSYNPSDKILTGRYTMEGVSKQEVDIISVNISSHKIVIDGNIAAKLNAGDLIVITNSQDNDGTYTVVSATDNGGNTDIIVSETFSSNNTPLGELRYNNDSAAGMLKKAQDKLYDIFWELIDKARKKGSYYFSSGGGPYKFKITGNSGADFAESVEHDFNEPLADEIANLPSGKISITGSANNNGEYNVTSVVADGADVRVVVSQALPSDTADGNLNINELFPFASDNITNALKVATDLTGILFAGDTVTVSGSKSVDGDYTVYSLDYDGTETSIVVDETIPAPDSTGKLSYSKSFKITAVNGDKITFKGGYGEKTVELFIEFINGKFFSHEGFHVVEHVLLRPKVKGTYFTDATAETFSEELAANGSLYFNKTLPILKASSTEKTFTVAGNMTGELDNDPLTDMSTDIYVSGTGANDGYYLVKGVQYDSVNDYTVILTKEQIPVEMLSNPVGEISYLKGAPITAVSAAGISVTVAEPKALEIFTGEVAEIRGSSDGTNNGRYEVKSVTGLGTHQQVVLSRVEAEIKDKLLNIVLDEDDCDACKIQDPYTCIASVILPHWQGRFDNMDFRRFFERQLRLEAPAHVFLNICWISCEQMDIFEEKYKRWLVENARTIKDYGNLSASQNELVDILNRLRNIYPSGVLHDCDEDETLENAIILGSSVLGNE